MIPRSLSLSGRGFVAAITCATLISVSSSAANAASFGRQDGAPQQLVDELHAIVAKAERERSADRDFLNALRDFIDKHDQPWSRSVLNDAFADGNYTRSPTWKVTQGQFSVDRRYGLYSRASVNSSQSNSATGGQQNKQKVAEQLATALLGSILNQGKSNNSAPDSTAQRTNTARGEARITTTINSTNVFAIDVDISGLSTGGALQLGMQESAASRIGYRVILEADGRLQMIRLNDRGSAILDSADTSTLSDNQRQRVRWTRGRTGRMRLELNGRVLLDATDRTNDQGFSEFSIVNVGGELGVRQVAISTSQR